MKKEYYDYIYNNRMTGFYHPTRERIMSLFYELKENPDAISNCARFYLNNLNGEPGFLNDNAILNAQYTILNCCFYFCEFLIDNNVDSELVYNSSDYLINKVSKVKTLDQAYNLLNEITLTCIELLKMKASVSYSKIIVRSIHYINQHLYSTISLYDVSAYIGFTPQYLTTLFKQETGMPLYNYIQYKKIEEAKALIRYTSKSFTLIANALGYSSIAHFSNAFKANTGMTPSQYSREKY
jgi:AraC-type DNA-binding domain-containing proteins